MSMDKKLKPSINSPIQIVPAHLLKKMLELEEKHNALVDAEEASKKKRNLIISEMVGIKKLLEDHGFNVEAEIEQLRAKKV